MAIGMFDKRGFLLVELLVALAVLSIVVVPLMMLLTLGAETQSRARMHTVAATLAREKMEEVRSGGFCTVTSEGESEVDGFERFRRKVDVVDETLVKEVRVTVTWEVGGELQALEIITFLSRR